MTFTVGEAFVLFWCIPISLIATIAGIIITIKQNKEKDASPAAGLEDEGSNSDRSL